MNSLIHPLKRNLFRPSSLDSLAQCGWYRSESTPGSAAVRGRSLDEALRDYFAGRKVNIDPTDQHAFEWAVSTTRTFATGHALITDKWACKIDIPGFLVPGECDAIIPGALASLDWKSGQIRSYRLQQAAYSLGQMRKRFAVDWTTAVLFFDQEHIVVHRFSEEEVVEELARASAAYAAPGPPAANPNCNWCANFFECPLQLHLAAKALALKDQSLDWPAIKIDPERLGEFLLGADALKAFEKEGRVLAREFFLSKTQVPGFRFSKGRTSYYLPNETLRFLLSKRTREEVETALSLVGDVSKEFYLKLCDQLGLSADATLLKSTKGDPFVVKK